MLNKDFAYCKLTAAVTSSATSVPVDECSRLPTSAEMAADLFLMTFESTYALGEFEIVQVTAKSASSGPGTLTIVRGMPAYAHAIDTVLKHAVTAAMLGVHIGPSAPTNGAMLWYDTDETC